MKSRTARIIQILILLPWIFVVAALQIALMGLYGISAPPIADGALAFRFLAKLVLLLFSLYIPAQGYYLLLRLIWKGAADWAKEQLRAWGTFFLNIPSIFIALVFCYWIVVPPQIPGSRVWCFMGPIFLIVAVPNIYFLIREMLAYNKRENRIARNEVTDKVNS